MQECLGIVGIFISIGSFGVARKCSIKLPDLAARLAALRCKASKSCLNITTAYLPRRATCYGTRRKALSTRALKCASASCRRKYGVAGGVELA